MIKRPAHAVGLWVTCERHRNTQWTGYHVVLRCAARYFRIYPNRPMTVGNWNALIETICARVVLFPTNRAITDLMFWDKKNHVKLVWERDRHGRPQYQWMPWTFYEERDQQRDWKRKMKDPTYRAQVEAGEIEKAMRDINSAIRTAQAAITQRERHSQNEPD